MRNSATCTSDGFGGQHASAASGGAIVTSSAANAAPLTPPAPPAPGAFEAQLCEGSMGNPDPRINEAGAVVSNAALVIGERLDAYNQGRIVPLYDAWGTTILMQADTGTPPNAAGVVQIDPNYDFAAYPPICGTRYEPSAGGAISEWMFCTDSV